jgi:hypothetical protein
MSLVPVDIGLSGFNLGNVGVTVLVVLVGIIVAVGVFALGWMILQRMQYKITVNLWSKSGSGGVYTVDKARIRRDPTTRRPDTIELRKTKITEQYPGSDYLYYTDRGGMMLNGVVLENKVVFFRIDDLFPPPQLFSASYKQSDFHGLARSLNDARNKWSPKGFFEKYGPMLASGVLVVVILIFMIVISNQLGDVSEAIERGLTSFGRSAAGGSI